MPEVLVDEEVQQRVHDLSHRLEEQRISIDQFLQATGRTGDELVAEVRRRLGGRSRPTWPCGRWPRPRRSTSPTTSSTTELDAMAARMEIDPAGVYVSSSTTAGRTGAVRSEQRKAKALTWLIDHVDVVDEEGNPVSRDDLEVEWSQRRDGTDAGGGAGRPGSDGRDGSDRGGRTMMSMQRGPLRDQQQPGQWLPGADRGGVVQPR